MVGDEQLIWVPLIVIAVGHSINRMGPSFERSRFGPPLMLLGFTCLILFPGDLTTVGSELHESILRSVFLVTPFTIGTILIVRYSPTYGASNLFGIVSGWLVIAFSWILLYSARSSFSLSGTLGGALALLGSIVSLMAITIGTSLAERTSGMSNESEPLSNEEESLVRTILERRLGGDGHGN